MNSNHFWTFTILIIAVIPSLRTGDISCFWRMTVCNDEVSIRDFFHSCCIFIYSFFLNGIFDQFSFFILIKICEFSLPVIFLAQNNCLIRSFTIRQEFNSHFSWAFTVLVILIVPGFGEVNAGFAWSMSISQIKTVHFS